jgi:hypothetical protein
VGPPRTLTWQEQGVFALITDSKNSEWVETPLLSSEDTKLQRIGTLNLSADGDLEGDIRELFWGNESINWRIQHARQTTRNAKSSFVNRSRSVSPNLK